MHHMWYVVWLFVVLNFFLSYSLKAYINTPLEIQSAYVSIIHVLSPNILYYGVSNASYNLLKVICRQILVRTLLSGDYYHSSILWSEVFSAFATSYYLACF